jgi:hypothetical protein
MVAMWMIFAEATAVLRARGESPRFYECVMTEGAAAKNGREREGYLGTGLGVAAIAAGSPPLQRAER